MLPIPDHRAFSALTRPAAMAFAACAAGVVALQGVLQHAHVLAAVSASAYLAATLLGWRGSLARREAIRTIATSNAGGVALGYVELCGSADHASAPALRSQIRKRPCVWYRYRIERRVGASWITEAAEASEDCFLLRDATGECVIDPEGAEVIPRHRRRWREFGHRYHEQWIAPGERLYVLGELTSIAAALDSPADFRADVSALLREWKRDRPDLLRRFDSDRNGELSDEEWTGARKQARAAVEREYNARRALGPLNVVRKPRDGRRYLISVYEPAQLADRFLIWAWLHLGLFVAGIVAIVRLA